MVVAQRGEESMGEELTWILGTLDEPWVGVEEEHLAVETLEEAV